MDFITYEKTRNELTERRVTCIAVLMQDCLALINNGFGSDPRIEELLDDMYSIEIAYQIQVARLDMDFTEWISS